MTTYTNPSPSNPEPRPFGIAWIEGIFGILAGVWLYFTGWVYSYYYFQFFHLDPFEIDTPLQWTMVEAFTPIRYFILHYYFPFGVICAFLAIIFLAIRRSPIGDFWRKHRRGANLILFALFVIVSFMGGFKISKEAADDQSRATWISNRDPEIQLSFKTEQTERATQQAPDTILPLEPLAAYSDKHLLRLLLTTKDNYYVFAENPKQHKKNYVPDGWVFKIPKETIRYAKIRRRGWLANEPGL